jgi:hypothetical protein
VIFDFLKENNFAFLFVYTNGDIIHLIKQNGMVFIKESGASVVYPEEFMDIYSSTPIEKVMVLYDQYGPSYKNIFQSCFVEASVKIQRAWKRYTSRRRVLSGSFIKMRNFDTIKVIKRKV